MLEACESTSKLIKKKPSFFLSIFKSSNRLPASSVKACLSVSCVQLLTFTGWEAPFYIYGGTAAIFSLVWYFVVFDSPLSNTRISQEELEYIEKGIPTSRDKVFTILYTLKEHRDGSHTWRSFAHI